jgi:hypothetical protein
MRVVTWSMSKQNPLVTPHTRFHCAAISVSRPLSSTPTVPKPTTSGAKSCWPAS